MIVSDEACKAIKEFLDGNDDSFARVGEITIGCACHKQIVLGVTVDDEFDEEEDVRFEYDGIPVVMDKGTYKDIDKLNVSLDPEKGLVVTKS